MYTALELGLELSDLLQWDSSITDELKNDNYEHDYLNDDEYELPF